MDQKDTIANSPVTHMMEKEDSDTETSTSENTINDNTNNNPAGRDLRTHQYERNGGIKIAIAQAGQEKTSIDHRVYQEWTENEEKAQTAKGKYPIKVQIIRPRAVYVIISSSTANQVAKYIEINTIAVIRTKVDKAMNKISTRIIIDNAKNNTTHTKATTNTKPNQNNNIPEQGYKAVIKLTVPLEHINVRATS
ncbi:hypothetical protein CHS0354_014749 [Potamilus streckersoni]|uniref:Uncharacterized protein n=1 Tax=Potamilus streckersoni TaxID=2493646 RepID=A0AAE0W0F2_9BIVA|nr:hypothetical protein CHS0354_014749 [Potamilus streckersoni]